MVTVTLVLHQRGLLHITPQKFAALKTTECHVMQHNSQIIFQVNHFLMKEFRNTEEM